jgi:hypothetical protein
MKIYLKGQKSMYDFGNKKVFNSVELSNLLDKSESEVLEMSEAELEKHLPWWLADEEVTLHKAHTQKGQQRPTDTNYIPSLDSFAIKWSFADIEKLIDGVIIATVKSCMRESADAETLAFIRSDLFLLYCKAIGLNGETLRDMLCSIGRDLSFISRKKPLFSDPTADLTPQERYMENLLALRNIPNVNPLQNVPNIQMQMH